MIQIDQNTSTEELVSRAQKHSSIGQCICMLINHSSENVIVLPFLIYGKRIKIHKQGNVSHVFVDMLTDEVIKTWVLCFDYKELALIYQALI